MSSFKYLCYRSTVIINILFFQGGIDFKRQIFASRDVKYSRLKSLPCAKRVKLSATVFKSIFYFENILKLTTIETLNKIKACPKLGILFSLMLVNNYISEFC